MGGVSAPEKGTSGREARLGGSPRATRTRVRWEPGPRSGALPVDGDDGVPLDPQAVKASRQISGTREVGTFQDGLIGTLPPEEGRPSASCLWERVRSIARGWLER